MTPKLAYSVEEAARLIGVSKNTIYALAKARKIPVIQIGRRYIINAELFDDWFRKQCENHTNIPI